MLIKALELFLIADVGGPEMDQGSTVRYFSEMVSFPTALLGDSISFEPVDDRSARVALTDGGDAASAVMFFGETGKLIGLVAERCQFPKDGPRCFPESIRLSIADGDDGDAHLFLRAE